MPDMRDDQGPKIAFSDAEAASFAYENGQAASLDGHRCHGGLVMQLVTQRGRKLGPVVLSAPLVEELIALLRKHKFLPRAQP